MPIRSTPPPAPVKASSDKIVQKLEQARIRAIYKSLLAFLALVHFIAAIVITGEGLNGYVRSWRNLFLLLLDQPLFALLIGLVFLVLYKGVEMWHNADPREIVLPPFPPVPDLRFTNSIYIGSAWTRRGKQPGDVFSLDDDDDELFDPEDVHVILNEKGLFGNIQVTGGVGSGKTSSLIQPFIWQGISKYPKPPHPDTFQLGSDGRYHLEKNVDSSGPSWIKRLWGILRGQPAPEDPMLPLPSPDWHPYVGMTREEALAEYERLLEMHQRLKWGMFIMDPKGDLTEFVLRAAACFGRSEDVIVLRPDGEATYNPLEINANPGVQAELVMDGIEAVSGQPIQPYWRGTMAEWLENALALLRVVDPTRMTFKGILRLARNESLRTQMVSEAENIMRRAQEEEERLRRLGREYTGIRVDPAMVEFFRDWDDEEADPQLKRAVVSGIKTQSKFFVNSELAPFLCPEMPPTFGGFENMIDKGQIVVLRMPLDTWGPVARVLGILVMADAQQVARARINQKHLNQERVVAFCVDEISAYLNQSTKDFIAMNRQSRVCFLAAHQTQGQLVRRGDPGFQDAFKDNLRTKICFSTPNADAARKDASIMGSRRVYKQSVTESTTFHRVERVSKDAIKPLSPEGASMSIRVDEVDRYWFAPEDFMQLRTGEAIIAEFDGETTKPPRKIKAPQFYLTPLQQLADQQVIDLRIRRPHPIVLVGSKPRDIDYIGAALVQTGYVIIEPLANAQSELEGFKFVTDVGTVIASLDQIEEVDDVVEERLTDEQILVLFADFDSCAAYFAQSLGFQFARVLSLVDVWVQTAKEGIGASTFAELYAQQTGEALPYRLVGSWEYHLALKEHHDAILGVSRRIIDLFTALGDRLAALGDERLEEMYEATRERIAAFVARASSGHSQDDVSDVPEATSEEAAREIPDAPASEEDSAAQPAPEDLETYFSSAEDPFSGEHYPDELDQIDGTDATASATPAPEESPTTAAEETGAAMPQPPSSSDRITLKRGRPTRRRKRTEKPLPLFRDAFDDDLEEDVVDFHTLEFPVDIEHALMEAEDADDLSPRPATGRQRGHTTRRRGRPRKKRTEEPTLPLASDEEKGEASSKDDSPLE